MCKITTTRTAYAEVLVLLYQHALLTDDVPKILRFFLIFQSGFIYSKVSSYLSHVVTGG